MLKWPLLLFAAVGVFHAVRFTLGIGFVGLLAGPLAWIMFGVGVCACVPLLNKQPRF